MTALELKNFIRTILVIPRTKAQELTVLDAVIDFISKALIDGIPDWTNLLTFNTDGTGAGKFSIKPDTNGKIRLWKTKTDGNIGNQPPTNPLTTEDAFWIEVSPGDGSAIPEWAPKIFGAGLVIVYYDITGTYPSLYKLVEPTRPFESTDFEAELAAGKWKKMTSDVGDVLDVLLAGLSTASTANVTAADSILVAIGKLQANKQRTIFKDGSQAMEANLDMNNNKILQVAAATANGEAVNFEQLNAALDGLKPKADCRAATTADIVLNGLQTIDDVVLAEDDRALVKDQADATENGIWIVKDSAAWERAADADSAIELQGAYVQVSMGTANANTAWVQYSIDVIIGVTNLLWRQVSSSVPDATPTTKGKMKLFADLLNSYTDGSVTQGAIVTALNLLEAIIQNSTSTNTSIAGVDAYTGVLDPPITAYVKGQTFKLTDVTANTVTNPTLALDGLAVKNIVTYKNTALGVGDFVGTVIVMYDGAAFRMIGGGGGGTAATTTFTPAGGLASDNVQAALEELDAEKQDELGFTPEPVLGFTPEDVANKATGTGVLANSDTTYPSEKKVKARLDLKEDLANKDIDSTFAADSDTKYPSQKAVKTAMDLKAPLASPTFTGTPLAPTQTVNDNSEKLATTAYVKNEFDSLNAYTLNKISLQMFNTY